MPSPSSKFSLCGGHPALDWVNSLDNRFRDDGPDELLENYGDLLRFTEQTGLLGAAQSRYLATQVDETAGGSMLQAALKLREAAAALFYQAAVAGTPPGAPSISLTTPITPATYANALQLLERHLTEARRHQHLQWSAAGTKLIWSWSSPNPEPQRPVWLLAIQTSDLLMSDDMTRLRTCECDTCRWLFLDTSKNHSRRWCDMKVCGNRMKARRFQARREL
jgi:predicted RNA-binding Zn ribbon-like protein